MSASPGRPLLASAALAAAGISIVACGAADGVTSATHHAPAITRAIDSTAGTPATAPAVGQRRGHRRLARARRTARQDGRGLAKLERAPQKATIPPSLRAPAPTAAQAPIVAAVARFYRAATTPQHAAAACAMLSRRGRSRETIAALLGRLPALGQLAPSCVNLMRIAGPLAAAGSSQPQTTVTARSRTHATVQIVIATTRRTVRTRLARGGRRWQISAASSHEATRATR